MSVEISFCPLCAGKLDSGNNNKFVCDDCETRFLIQVVDEDDEGMQIEVERYPDSLGQQVPISRCYIGRALTGPSS